MICGELAAKLSHDGFLLDCLGRPISDAGVFRELRNQAKLTASQLRSDKAADKVRLLRNLLNTVKLDEGEIRLTLDRAGLGEVLGACIRDLPAKELDLTIAAIPKRSGHQLKLVVPNEAREIEVEPKYDAKLIALILEAFEARDLVLANPSLSMNALAKQQGRCRTRLAKLVGISCLAPHLVEAIAGGRQPSLLTAEFLLAKQLPIAWPEQARRFEG